MVKSCEADVNELWLRFYLSLGENTESAFNSLDLC